MMVLGTVSTILGLIVFAQKKFRRNPCSIYFAATNTANFLFIYSLILSITLYTGFGIDISAYNLVACRLVIYHTFLFDVLSASYLILTSVDRILITSSNVLTRQRSTRRLSIIGVVSVTLFWMMFHSHAFVFVSIQELGPGLVVCYYQPGPYPMFIGYYFLLVKGILVPGLMGIFGLWAIRNICSVRRRRVAPGSTVADTMAGSGRQQMTPKDRQLVLMLLVDIGSYFTFNAMLSIVYMHEQITQAQIQTIEQIRTNMFFRLTAVFLSYVPHCADLYGHLLVSRTFRREVKRLLSCKA